MAACLPNLAILLSKIKPMSAYKLSARRLIESTWSRFNGNMRLNSSHRDVSLPTWPPGHGVWSSAAHSNGSEGGGGNLRKRSSTILNGDCDT